MVDIIKDIIQLKGASKWRNRPRTNRATRSTSRTSATPTSTSSWARSTSRITRPSNSMLSAMLSPPVSLLPRTLSGISSSPYHIRNNYATFDQIRTKTITIQGQRGEGKKAKLFITLRRHPDFEENMKKFNEIREENDKSATKKTETATKQ